MRIVMSANGPGEVAGWVRPLVRRIYARQPDAEIHIFLVPDDYASGHEAEALRNFFLQAHIHDPREYIAFALGRSIADAPTGADLVLYIGGDIMHAVRLHRKLGGVAATYKFSKSTYKDIFARAFAVDEPNAQQLRRWQIPEQRISIVGNLAVDGALLDADAAVEPGAPHDGILIMPGSRKHEIEHLIPFFFTATRRILSERPEIPIAFGISPFTSLDAVRAAIEHGGDGRMWSEPGRLTESPHGVFLESLDGKTRIPVLRNAMAAARTARLVVTIPGTKAIELAVLGKPVIVCSPLNLAELVPINGPLTYLNRIPLVGVPLKRAVVSGVSKHFRFHSQPNIDMNEMVICELHGTLSPGRVARVTLERFDDTVWLDATALRLRELYIEHIGASDRMAEMLITLIAEKEAVAP